MFFLSILRSLVVMQDILKNEMKYENSGHKVVQMKFKRENVLQIIPL